MDNNGYKILSLSKDNVHFPDSRNSRHNGLVPIGVKDHIQMSEKIERIYGDEDFYF